MLLYLNLVAIIIDGINAYFAMPTILLLTNYDQFMTIVIRYSWGTILALGISAGAYYQFKPVLFYNLYLFVIGLKSVVDAIMNYKTQHSADFGLVVLHLNFSLNDFFNIFVNTFSTFLCLPGLMLLGIYTIRWIKQVKLRQQVSHSRAKGD